MRYYKHIDAEIVAVENSKGLALILCRTSKNYAYCHVRRAAPTFEEDSTNSPVLAADEHFVRISRDVARNYFKRYKKTMEEYRNEA